MPSCALLLGGWRHGRHRRRDEERSASERIASTGGRGGARRRRCARTVRVRRGRPAFPPPRCDRRGRCAQRDPARGSLDRGGARHRHLSPARSLLAHAHLGDRDPRGLARSHVVGRCSTRRPHRRVPRRRRGVHRSVPGDRAMRGMGRNPVTSGVAASACELARSRSGGGAQLLAAGSARTRPW